MSDDINVVHEWNPPDLLALKNEDPNYHYRWCKANDENINYKMHALGYRIAEDAQMRDSLCDDFGAKDSGEIARQVGDLILMKCPRALYEARRTFHDKRVDENSSAGREKFKKEVQSFSQLSKHEISTIDHSDMRKTNKKYFT